MSVEPSKPAAPPAPAPAPAPGLEAFTARELDAAEQLILLSESSTSTGGRGRSVASAGSGSSSPHSVNAPPDPAPAPSAQAVPRGVGVRGDGEEVDDEQELPGSPRKTRRYRPIAEIYRATGRIARWSLKKNKE
ncbi:hypothetical protein ACP70R_044573 [Stipagrostis hirtigluma subsp. patula]